MNHFRRIFTEACIFCTLITLVFFFFAALINEVENTFGDVGLSLARYLLIVLFSFLIAGANRLFCAKGLHLALRFVLHYALLLTAFLVIFIAAGNIKISGSASVFVAIVVFTVFYAAIAGVWLALLHAVRGKGKDAQGRREYTPRYR